MGCFGNFVLNNPSKSVFFAFFTLSFVRFARLKVIFANAII